MDAATRLGEKHKNEIGIVRFDSKNSQGEFIPDDKDESDIASVISKHSASTGITKTDTATRKLFNHNEDETAEGKGRNTTGSHAMVLLGGRSDEKNPKKKFLLFENWWEEMPLVEVSDDYFKAAKGILIFLARSEIESFGMEDDSRCTYLIAESNNIDRPEGHYGCFGYEGKASPLRQVVVKLLYIRTTNTWWGLRVNLM